MSPTIRCPMRSFRGKEYTFGARYPCQAASSKVFFISWGSRKAPRGVTIHKRIPMPSEAGRSISTSNARRIQPIERTTLKDCQIANSSSSTLTL